MRIIIFILIVNICYGQEAKLYVVSTETASFECALSANKSIVFLQDSAKMYYIKSYFTAEQTMKHVFNSGNYTEIPFGMSGEKGSLPVTNAIYEVDSMFKHNFSDIFIGDPITIKDTLFFHSDTITKLVNVSGVTTDAYRCDSIIAGEYAEFGGLPTYFKKQTLLNNGSIVLPASTCGFGTIIIGDNQEFTQFRWSINGMVTLLNPTANVINTDTISNLCVFDSGSAVTIRNRLGSTLSIKIFLINSTS